MRNEWDIANEKAFVKKEGHAEGVAEGFAKGLAKGKAEVAKALLANGIDVSIISNCTGLSEEKIKAIRV